MEGSSRNKVAVGSAMRNQRFAQGRAKFNLELSGAYAVFDSSDWCKLILLGLSGRTLTLMIVVTMTEKISILQILDLSSAAATFRQASCIVVARSCLVYEVHSAVRVHENAASGKRNKSHPEEVSARPQFDVVLAHKVKRAVSADPENGQASGHNAYVVSVTYGKRHLIGRN